MANKAVILCALSMLSLSLFGMKQDNFSIAPKEIQEYILTLALDPNNIKQSIRQLHKLRSISKSLRDLISQRFTIAHLAKKFGVTERAIALHIIQTFKLNREQAYELLAQYPTDKDLDKPLLEAVKAGDKERILALLLKNANINAQDEDGDAAFIWAIRKGKKDIVELLLKNGANPNVESNQEGATALMIAVTSVNKNIVELLLKHGADINAQYFGDSALIRASLFSNKSMVELLLNAGAGISLISNDKKTALDMVNMAFEATLSSDHKRRYKEIGRVLLEALIKQKKAKGAQRAAAREKVSHIEQ